MDYAGMNAGVKVMLPVNEPGALLFIGDGHALQGEGEVVGTGLETSMDVEFSVQVVKKTPIQWPRLENETHIMVLGSERPLIEALQHATSGDAPLADARSIGLSERGASTLMGQTLEYEVGERRRSALHDGGEDAQVDPRRRAAPLILGGANRGLHGFHDELEVVRLADDLVEHGALTGNRSHVLDVGGGDDELPPLNDGHRAEMLEETPVFFVWRRDVIDDGIGGVLTQEGFDDRPRHLGAPT